MAEDLATEQDAVERRIEKHEERLREIERDVERIGTRAEQAEKDVRKRSSPPETMQIPEDVNEGPHRPGLV